MEMVVILWSDLACKTGAFPMENPPVIGFNKGSFGQVEALIICLGEPRGILPLRLRL